VGYQSKPPAQQARRQKHVQQQKTVMLSDHHSDVAMASARREPFIFHHRNTKNENKLTHTLLYK
jgi:hypothetical protein